MVQNLFHFLISIALPIPTALGRSGKPPTSPRAALGCAWLRLAALGCAWRCRCGGQRSTRRECGRVGILAQQRARLYIETKSIHQVSTSLNFSSSRKSRKSSYLEITMVDNLQMSKAHKKQSTVGSWSSENGVKSSCDSRKILCN